MQKLVSTGGIQQVHPARLGPSDQTEPPMTSGRSRESTFSARCGRPPIWATTFCHAAARHARFLVVSVSLPASASPRSRLAATLWDRVPDFQARASFRQAFRELVVAFGPLARRAHLRRSRDHLAQYHRLLDRCAGCPRRPSSDRSRIAASSQLIVSGDLLEELDGISVVFDHWLLERANALCRTRRALLEAELATPVATMPDANERAEIARRLIMFDPTHEGASRILMRALADMGERAQALREYARCREALKVTLDVEPSLETCALRSDPHVQRSRREDEQALRLLPTPRNRSAEGADARAEPQSAAGRRAAVSGDRPARQ